MKVKITEMWGTGEVEVTVTQQTRFDGHTTPIGTVYVDMDKGSHMVSVAGHGGSLTIEAVEEES